MGRLKDALWDWLEDYGYELGYNWDNYPQVSKWKEIQLNKITAKEYYNGKQAQKENQAGKNINTSSK